MKIGIDPDSSKSGVAIKTGKTIKGFTMAFFELYNFLNAHKGEIEIIKIEAGWLNKKSNFRAMKSMAIAEKVAKNVGANHETGKKIVEMCEFLQIPYKTVMPLRKIWKGANKKITHIELMQLVKYQNINLINKQTNQEVRDATLLIL